MPGKQRGLAMLLALCLLVMAPGIGTGESMQAPSAGAITLPVEIADALSGPAWAEWTPVAINEESLTAPWNNAAVLLRREGRNVLVLLRREGGVFVPYLSTALVVYQGAYTPHMSLDEQDTNLTLAYQEPPDDGAALRLAFGFFQNEWLLDMIYLGSLEDGDQAEKKIGVWPMKYDFMRETPDGIHTDRVFGQLQYHLWNVDINGLPHSLDEAQNIVGPPAPLTQADEQRDPLPEGAPWRLQADGEVPVYASPLPSAGIAPQATLAADAAVTLIGFQGHMALIAYDAQGRAAYGFVPLVALDDTWEGVKDLQLSYRRGEMLQNADLLDGQQGAFVRPLVAGDPVTYLATLGASWSYIEAEDGVRGFVRSDDLAVRYGLSTWHPETPDANKTQARVTRTVQLIDDPYRTLTPEVLAEIPAQTLVYYHDNLYGEWAYIEYKHSEGAQMGFVPREAVESVGELALEGNG